VRAIQRGEVHPLDAAAGTAGGEAVSKWIPVTERLPGLPVSKLDDSVAVLAWSKSNGIGIAHCIFDDDYRARWSWECVGDPTHWMPLPEPPVPSAPSSRPPETRHSLRR